MKEKKVIQTIRRNNFIDFAKAVAIISVVMGHCIQYGSGADSLNKDACLDDPIFIFIYSFHMPLFMLLSGYLFAYSTKRRSITENIQRKFMALVVPIIAWATVSCLINAINDIYHNNINQPVVIIKSYISDIIFRLWFLWAIFLNSAVILIIRKYLRDSLIVYLGVVFLCLFIPNAYNTDLYSFMFPYYVIGYKYNTFKNILSNYIVKSSALYCCVAILFFSLLLLYNRDSYIYISGYNILNGDVIYHLYIDIYRFFVGLIGSCFVLLSLEKIYSLIKRSGCMGPLLYIGQQTMGIYIIQGYIIPWGMVKFTKDLQGVNYIITSVESIVIIILCLLCIYVLQKTEITKRLFL